MKHIITTICPHCGEKHNITVEGVVNSTFATRERPVACGNCGRVGHTSTECTEKLEETGSNYHNRYNKAELIRDIELGNLSIPEIAQKHGISRGLVYWHRNKLKDGTKNGWDKILTLPLPKVHIQTIMDTPAHASLREKMMELFEGGLDVEECVDALPEHDSMEVRAIFRDLTKNTRRRVE